MREARSLDLHAGRRSWSGLAAPNGHCVYAIRSGNGESSENDPAKGASWYVRSVCVGLGHTFTPHWAALGQPILAPRLRVLPSRALVVPPLTSLRYVQGCRVTAATMSSPFSRARTTTDGGRSDVDAHRLAVSGLQRPSSGVVAQHQPMLAQAVDHLPWVQRDGMAAGAGSCVAT